MKDLFDVDNSSLEASVKAYHKKVVEPLYGKLGNIQGNPDIPLDNLITKENIGEQSVKYAESAGTVDWSNISNIPPNLPASSDPSASTDHSHANKPVLDKFSTDDNGNVLYGGKEMATVEQYTSIKETVDDMSTELGNTITKDNIGEQSVKYAESAGSVDWDSVNNKPESLPASDVSDWAKADTKPEYSWDEIQNKPTSLPADEHTHNVSDITDFPKQMPASDVSDWAKADTKPEYSWDEIQNKPTSLPADEHTHNVSDITDFPKQMPASDVHDWAKEENKPSYSWDEIQNKPTEFPTTPDHTHDNKSILDSIAESGLGNKFLADDGTYKEIITISPTEPSDTNLLWIDNTDASNPVLKVYGTEWVTVGGVSTSITIDDIMSDQSTNPVQNKVIKEYIDQKESVNISQEEDNALELKDDGLYVQAGSLGNNGKSAYETWLELGNEGTEEDFIESLRGEDGESAYEAWLALGNTGTKEDFINSLKGEGASGETSSGSSSSNVINMHQKIILDAVNGNAKYLSNDGNKIENVFVQAYKFVEGDTSVVEVLKSFDNTEEENFNFNSDNTEFNDTEGMKIQDTYVYSGLEEYTTGGLYITEPINLDEFKEIDTIKISK